MAVTPLSPGVYVQQVTVVVDEAENTQTLIMEVLKTDGVQQMRRQLVDAGDMPQNQETMFNDVAALANALTFPA